LKTITRTEIIIQRTQIQGRDPKPRGSDPKSMDPDPTYGNPTKIPKLKIQQFEIQSVIRNPRSRSIFQKSEPHNPDTQNQTTVNNSTLAVNCQPSFCRKDS